MLTKGHFQKLHCGSGLIFLRRSLLALEFHPINLGFLQSRVKVKQAGSRASAERFKSYAMKLQIVDVLGGGEDLSIFMK